ncbi:DUF2970 domain-containing protein [Ferrimonas balearica]|uniref:DUF2970 domain-containing protein n=1 Tax=Ferrimonas balearica TaxID=44012 RepID=UPI001C99623D|nr:DUF2970 domain-containing protein [Ferrimonas balearica]MBY5992099.1 DUF2970 domain-containing protein [Ferrimonas balearica]
MRVLLSVLAALFGVQSERNRQRDFASASPLPYILTGLMAVILFVLGLVAVVNLVLSGSV